MKRWFLPALVFACLSASIIMTGVMIQRAETSQRTLEGLCRAAMWEASEEMQALSLSLEKTAVSADAAQDAALLSQISRSASDVCRSLSFLPLSHAAMAPTLTFANQLADYAASLLPRTASGGLSAADREQLRSHLALCTQLAAQILLAREDMERTGFSHLADNAFYAPADASARPLESLADQDNGMQYPTLIYDGPFSDARHAGMR